MITFRDVQNETIQHQAVTPGNVTTTTSGTYGDFINGDGRVTLHVNLKATSLTSITHQVKECATTNGTYTDISGFSIVQTTDGVSSANGDRAQRYLKVVQTINGTTGLATATLFQPKKSTY